MLARLSKRIKGRGEKADGWNEKKTIDGQSYYFHGGNGSLSWEKPFELLSSAEKEDGKATWVWVPHPTNIWQPAKLLKELKNGMVEVKLENGRKSQVARGVMMADSMTGGRSQMVPLWDLNYSSLRRPEEDLVMLDSHNEAMLIHNLRVRYVEDELYTWVGVAHTVLISVNPYKDLPLYGAAVIDQHANKPPNVQLMPHVYDIAQGAYEDMLYAGKNQSVLISGESGAGKTVCTKQCLNFLASVAGSASQIEEKIIMANPLLEAYGNAQTVRNNNSSRFGKYIDVHFDNVESHITSATISNYLLEKSRVVYQQAGERNFHVFYQLTGDTATKASLGLEGPEAYAYTNKSGVYKAHLIDDTVEHGEVLEAMQLLGFSDEETKDVFQLTAGVLLLGNVGFEKKSMKNGVTGSVISAEGRAALAKAAGFLSVAEADLEHVLTHRSISVRGRTSVIPLEPSKARAGGDSLAMAVYSNLFSWLVSKVNVALEGNTGKSIGILDIFGFEIFDVNSFEQLLINFANEKLQQQFNRTTFKEEEELYMKEGIDFQHVEFIDNQVVLDMLESRPNGILLMIDDEIKIPEGKETAFMNKVETTYKRHSKFQTDKHRRLEDSDFAKLNFEVAHYAGVVRYNALGFMQKNTDTLFQDLRDLCTSSGSELMQELFPAEEFRRQLKSLSSQFRKSLNGLMDSINETDSRYIRCVKPNDVQKPNAFDAQRVLEQLAYSGVFEAVEIRSRGFPFRNKYSQFACRYSCINTMTGYKYRTSMEDDEVALAKEVVAASKQDFGDVQYGKTMVLYRAAGYKLLELMRNLALETIIPKQQAFVRGGIAREMKRRVLDAQAKIAHALSVGNDIDLLDEALGAVEETIGPLRKLFPGAQPANLEAGRAHRANLALWKALEARLEELVKNDPETLSTRVYRELAEAVEEANELMHVPRTARQDELVADAKALRAECVLGKLDARAVEVLYHIRKEELQEVADEAKQHGHSNDDIAEIGRLLRLPVMDFVELEIAKAKELGDKPRQIDCEIRYEALFLAAHAVEYADIGTVETLKTAEEFAKKSAAGMAKMMGPNKVKRAETMLSWTKAAPATTLTDLEMPDKMAAKDFVAQLKGAREFAGDAKATKVGPAQAAASFLAYAKRADKPVVDELYLQLLKQLRSCPSPEAEGKYYELLGLLMSSVAPSRDIERYAVVFLQKMAPDETPARLFSSALHTTQYDRGITVSAGQLDAAIDAFKASEGSRFSVKRN